MEDIVEYIKANVFYCEPLTALLFQKPWIARAASMGFWLLVIAVYGICGDYGIAIAVITIAIRLCMVPLNRKQKQAMEQQQNLSLKVEEIKNKYKNNEVRRDKELQLLYQKEEIGSMGCR